MFQLTVLTNPQQQRPIPSSRQPKQTNQVTERNQPSAAARHELHAKNQHVALPTTHESLSLAGPSVSSRNIHKKQISNGVQQAQQHLNRRPVAHNGKFIFQKASLGTYTNSSISITMRPIPLY